MAALSLRDSLKHGLFQLRLPGCRRMHKTRAASLSFFNINVAFDGGIVNQIFQKGSLFCFSARSIGGKSNQRYIQKAAASFAPTQMVSPY